MTARELHCGGGLYECEATIDLKEAGLTHAARKADGCDGQHTVQPAAVTIDLDAAGLVAADDVATWEEALQVLHEQAHPRGTISWRLCYERGCREAREAER